MFSLIFGVISWIVPIRFIINKKGNICAYLILSFSFAMLAFVSEIYSYQLMAIKEDVSGFLDVASVGVYPAIILFVITFILNLFAVKVNSKLK